MDLRDAISSQINFDVPAGEPADGLFELEDGVFGVALARYPSVWCTVLDVSSPPDGWSGGRAFPTELLIAHCSPGWFSRRHETRNWLRWPRSKFRYFETADGSGVRMCFFPRQLVECERVPALTQLHVNVALGGLKRGDVLRLAGTVVHLAQLADDMGLMGLQLDHNGATATMGGEDCPWLMVESVDVFRDWPDGPVDIERPFDALGKYLAVQAPHLLADVPDEQKQKLLTG